MHGIVVSPDGNTVYAGGDFSAIGGGTRGVPRRPVATTGALAALAFQYPVVTFGPRASSDLDISPSGDRIFAALGGYENQALSWSTVTGRRQWSHQVDGDTQAVRYFNGNVYFGFHEGDLGDATVRMLAADAATGAVVVPYHLPINSFFGVWDIDASPDALVLGGEFMNVNGVATQGIAILPRGSNDAVAPTPPSNLHITGTTSTSISLAWNPGADDVGVVGYRVLRNGAEIAFPTDTTFTDTDLPAATDFTYEVQTVDAAGNFSPSAGPTPAGTDTTVVAAGSVWKYLDNGSNQGTAWRATAFDDTTWAAGPAQLGYGDGDEATVVSFGADPNNKPYTTYFRRQFTVANPAALSNVNLTLLRDDGAVVYLNGVEIARSNMPTGTITSTTAAVVSIDGAGESQLYPFPVDPARFVAGTNTLAVEVHQAYRASSDISFDLTLSTGRQLASAAPSNLHLTSVTGTSAGLAWDAPPGTITGYRVYRNNVLVGSPSGTTFSDPGLTSATSYSYTVTAINGANLESVPTTPLVVTTPDVVAPSTPGGLTAPTLSATRVVVAWTPSTDNVGVTGYDVLRDGVVVGSPTTATYTDNAVAGGQSYSYTVRAHDLAGNVSPESVGLAVATPNATDLTPPSVPQNLRTVTRSTTQLTLAWDASNDNVGVTGYVVSRDGVDLPTTSLTTLTDTLLAPGATYTYTVRALDAALNISGPSSALPVTTHLPVETTFAAGSVWKYTDDGIDLGTAWKELAFDDSLWKSGAGQLGYGDGDETTVMFNGGVLPADRYISHYLRRSVTLTDVSELNGVTLSVLRDDGVVVYVNGVEAFRDNMPAGTITNTTFASTAVIDAAESTYYDFAIPPTLFHNGTNVIAVSLHNESRQGTGDISFDARLTTRYGPVLVAPPTNLHSTAVTATSVDLAWDAPSGAITGYHVFRGGVLVGSPSGTTFSDTGLASAQSYAYTVTALGAANESAPSATLSLTTPDNVPPSAPTGLAAPSITMTAVGLTWTPSTDNVNVTGYDVLRDGAVIGSPTATAFTDSGVASGQTYSYTVRARDLAGNISAEGTPLPVTTPSPDLTAPSVPANVHTVGLAPNQVTLAWDASTDNIGVTGYDVLRDSVVIASPATATYSDTAVVSNHTYSYEVRARDAALNVSLSSTPLSVTTPGDVTAPVTTDNTASIGNAWRTTPATVTLSATDNLSGVAQTYSTTDGSAPTTASTTGTTITITAPGTYTIRYFSVDVAGNVEAVKTAGTQIRIDTTAPTAAVTFPVSGTFYNTARWNAGCATARICGTAADTPSGLASVGVTIQRSSDNRFWSGTTWQVASSTRPATGTSTWFVPLATSALTNGVTYTVTARSVDLAGNTSAPVTTTFTYDTTRPATSSVAVTNHSGSVQATVDTFTVTFAEALDPASVPANATLTLSRANGNTSYGISGLTNGLLTTGRNGYLTSSGTTRTVTFAGSLTLSNTNRTVTFTVTGACAGTCSALTTTPVSGQFAFTPAATLLDPAGNTATGNLTSGNQVMF